MSVAVAAGADAHVLIFPPQMPGGCRRLYMAGSGKIGFPTTI